MKASILLFSAILFFNVSQLNAQFTEEWVARYDSTGIDQLYDMTVDATGNVYVTGSSIQNGAFTPDFLTVKYNGSGLKLWEMAYDGDASSDDRARVITVDDSSNVIIAGSTAYDNTIVTIKYNSDGDTLWIRSYTGPSSGNNATYPTSLSVDDLGNVYVAGTSEGLIGIHGLFQDFTTIKYSPGGLPLWVSRYNGPGTDADVIKSMAIDSLGNVYVTGFAGGGSSGSSDSYNNITTIKYNTFGDTVWMRTYAGPGTATDEAHKLKIDENGNVYVTGKSFQGAAAQFDIVTIKYNADGTELWKKFFNGFDSDTDEGVDLAVDGGGNVFVTGTSDYGPPNDFDIITIKYDSLGIEKWSDNFDGSSQSNDASAEINLDGDGNIYVLGTTVNTTTSNDFQLIKYNTFGTQLLEKKYSNSSAAGSAEDAVSLFVDDLNYVYVAGMSALDYAVVKYSQTIGMNEHSVQNLFSIYPNPSNGKFFLKSGNTGIDLVEIYSIIGEKMIAFSQIRQNTLTEIDLTGQSKGVYLAKVTAGSTFYIQKIVLD